MKTFLLIKTTLFVAILFLTQQTIFAQLTCDGAEPIEYAGPDIQAVSTFSTVGVPNDNASALPLYCTTPVGTAGQHWYSLDLGNPFPITVSITTDLPQTNFDTKLHIYTGTCGALTCVAGDDDSGAGNTSTVIFDVQPNTTYLIRVGGYNNEAGITAISIDAGYLGCTDPSASNFDLWSVVDDGSCCYAGSIYLSNNTNVGNYATVYSNNVAIATVNPGETAYFCTQKTCDNYVMFYDFFELGWSTSSYTVTIDGITSNGTPPSYYTHYTNIDMETSYCGCTDPSAINFSSTAEMDNGKCYYVTNTSCADAILIEPNTFQWVNSENVPIFNGNVEGCSEVLFNRSLLWYQFVYPGGSVKINTPQSGFDTVLGIYEDCTGAPLACVDDLFIFTANSPAAYLSSNPFIRIDCEDGYVKGQTYYIAVGLFGGGATFALQYEVYDTPGCTDPLAINYNACASVEDGSCITQTCPADLDNSGFVNIADLLQFVSAYGSSCSN